MGTVLVDGRTGDTAEVDAGHRLRVRALVNSAQEGATEDGDSYNINTGLISFTTTVTETGIMYLKNNEVRDFHIEGIFLSIGPAADADVDDTCRIRIYKNATTGTLITPTPTNVDTNSNLNFSSSNTFSSDAFKGVEGETITNGTVHFESLINHNTRTAFPVSWSLGTGNSIAISIEPADSTTAMKVICAITGHLEDPNSVI